MTCAGLSIRPAQSYDWEPVVAVLPEWWGGRDLRDLLPRVFFEHFQSTSLIAELEGELVAFLVGFACPTHPDEAYIHFVGVRPDWRGVGLAADLYARFARLARRQERSILRCVTSPLNTTSIAFHEAMGFSVLPSPATVEGIPVRLDEDGPGDHRVHFELRLDDLPPGHRLASRAPEAGEHV
jgi:ribosomal protein S18 acetylase RimI-like enzyme